MIDTTKETTMPTTRTTEKTDEQMVQACFAQAQRDADREYPGSQQDYPNWSSCEVDWKRATVSLVHASSWEIVYKFTTDRLGRVRFTRDEKATAKATRARKKIARS